MAAVEMADERGEAHRLGDEGGERRARDPEARKRAETENEDRVERDVDADRQQHEIERRLGVARAAQHGHHEGIHVEPRQREEDDAHVGHGERQRVRRCAHGDEQGAAQHESRDRHAYRDRREEGGARADDPLGLEQVVGADVLADEDGRRHRHAEGGADQQEHDGVGVGGGGERRLTQETPDPDGIHRAIQRLQDVGEQDRQREAEQADRYRAFGERALHFQLARHSP